MIENLLNYLLFKRGIVFIETNFVFVKLQVRVMVDTDNVYQ